MSGGLAAGGPATLDRVRGSAPGTAVPPHAVDRRALERLADAGTLTALVDACDAPEVPARVLAHFPDGGACLYQGNEALVFRDRAPFLVRVDRALLAWLLAPSAEGGLGDTPWGLFVVSEAPFARLVRHWRGWLTVTPPAAEPSGDGAAERPAPWTFRFYDPRLAPVFLGACTPSEAAAFFGPARSLVVPAWEPAEAAGGAEPPAGWMVAPALDTFALASGTVPGAPRRAVGERFQLREAHLAAFRRRNFGDALIAGVEREAAATGQRAWRDPADPAAGDVLVSCVAAGAGDAAAVRPTRLSFDERGFVGAVTSPLGRRWETRSDAVGRPLRLTNPAGATLAFGYDVAGRPARATRALPGEAPRLVFAAEHDEVGRVTRATYADGTSALTAFHHAGDEGVLDPAGQRPSAVTDRLGRTTRYAYDADGDLASVTDPLGRVTRFAYANWRRPVAVTFPDGRRERYAYDDVGRLTAITGADGVALRVTCDLAGRMTGLASDGGAGVAPVGAVFARDDAGRVLEAMTAAPAAAGVPSAPTAVQFAYDDAGRVLSETTTVGVVALGGAAALPPGEAPFRTSVAYAYDAQGTLLGYTHPTGEQVTYGWDADGRLARVTDWSGREYALAYLPGDGGWRLTTPEGLVAATVQNAAGLPVVQTLTAPDGRALVRTALAYDDEDRVASVVDGRLGRWAYEHDAEGQLVACNGPTAAESARYAYDAAGNRVRVEPGERHAEPAPPEAAVTCDVDDGDRLLRQGAVRVAYDACGRAAERADDYGLGAGGRWRYAYDARGQLVRATGCGPDGCDRELWFAYDALGRRVWKLALARAFGGARVDAVRTRSVWAGERLVREVAERASWDAPAVGAAPGAARGESLGASAPPTAAWAEAEARDYLYWPGTATPLLLRVTRGAAGGPEPASATYVYHCDHLGAPVRLTDGGGRVVWEAAYAPFGGARLTVVEVAQPWRRPGQYADEETGLCYNRLRYYDPALGRYLTPDPSGLLGGANLYRYARNSPVLDADPLGLWPSLGTIVAAVAAVAVAVAVVALAPVALPLAILAAGVAAGATFGFLNEGLNNGFGCLECLAKATLKGAVVGGIAAVPFMFLPATAGVAAFAGVGGGSGFLGYAADWAVNGADPSQWSWRDAAIATGIGAVTAGGGRYLGPRVGNWWKGQGRPGPAPRDLANPLNYRLRVDPNKLGSNLGNVEAQYVGPGRGIPRAQYDRLRAKTPNDAIRERVNQGKVPPYPDPALPGQTVTGRLQADHIVPMKRITQMDGFADLPEDDMLKVLNHPDNFVGLSEAANKSKGARTFEQWTEHKRTGTPVDPAFRQRMMQRERELEQQLQEYIRQLRGQGAGTP